MDDGHFGYINTSIFISLCILTDLTQQKIPRELCSGADPAIFIRSHVSHGKIKGERDRSGKFNKTRRKEWRKEQEDIFAYLEVPILVCSPLVADALGLPPLWDPPSGEPIHMGTFPTTSQDWKKNTAPPVLLISPCIQVIIQAKGSSVRSNYCKQ